MDAPAITPRSILQAEPLAIASFVLSLCGWFGFAFVAWVPAIVCGHIARSKMHMAGNLQSDGFAVAGLVISYIGLALMVVAVILFFGFFATFWHFHPMPQVQIHLPSQP